MGKSKLGYTMYIHFVQMPVIFFLCIHAKLQIMIRTYVHSFCVRSVKLSDQLFKMSNVRETNKKTKIYTNTTMEKLKKKTIQKTTQSRTKKNNIKTGKMWLWSGLIERYIDCNN